AIEFLREEIELTPGRLVRLNELARRADMGEEPVDLFGDVRPGREQPSFLMQPVAVESGIRFHEAGDLLNEPCAYRLDRAGRIVARGDDELLDTVEMQAEHARELAAFRLAHDGQRLECF